MIRLATEAWTRLVATTRVNPVTWPPIEEELQGFHTRLCGRVLNAGAGDRDLARLVNGEVTNLDLPSGRHNANIHIYAPLDAIPCAAASFDAIICNAVLEHVANPDEVLQEFARVLRPGGFLYLCVPFLQPEHLDPTDFQRYTEDGLRRIAERHSFDVETVEPVHSVFHTLGWIVHTWLASSDSPAYVASRLVLYPVVRHLTKTSRTQVRAIASAYRLIATRRPNPSA